MEVTNLRVDKKAGIDYTHSEQNIGVCFAMNMMRTKVKTDYILFLNDDMYVLLWDKVLYDEIENYLTIISFFQLHQYNHIHKAHQPS